MTGAVSRKTHPGAGVFDVPLPLSGTAGVENRESGGSHTMIFTFNDDIFAGNASVVSGDGNVVGSPVTAGNAMIVDLGNVTNAQTLTVVLSGVSSTTGTMPNTAVSMSVLVADTTGDGAVNSSDVGQTKSQSGQAATAGNFRNDVNVNGAINGSDIGLVKSSSGTALP